MADEGEFVLTALVFLVVVSGCIQQGLDDKPATTSHVIVSTDVKITSTTILGVDTILIGSGPKCDLNRWSECTPMQQCLIWKQSNRETFFENCQSWCSIPKNNTSVDICGGILQKFNKTADVENFTKPCYEIIEAMRLNEGQECSELIKNVTSNFTSEPPIRL
jgi:hypothetical protein